MTKAVPETRFSRLLLFAAFLPKRLCLTVSSLRNHDNRHIVSDICSGTYNGIFRQTARRAVVSMSRYHMSLSLCGMGVVRYVKSKPAIPSLHNF